MVYYEGSQAEVLRREVAQLRRDDSVLRTSLSKSDQALEQALAAFHKELEQFHAEVVSERVETDETLASVQAAALRHADALASKLEKKRRQEEAAAQRQLTVELSRVKQSAAETSTRLNGILSDVGSVKSEVESVRSQASANLLQTRGDMGMMSDLIATNSGEIQMLRNLDDRNVYEFTLAKSNAHAAGGRYTGGALDRTDAKRNRFTVEILAADRRDEKRDKNVNEPVQFYVPGKGGQPYELVVNEVDGNTVKGYLATPKVAFARSDSGHPN